MLFSPFGIAITSLGEERANLSAFRTFVRFVLVWFVCSSSSWCLGRSAVCNCGTPLTFLTFFYSTDRSKAMVPVLVLLFVALWSILRGDLLYVLPGVSLFLCVFSPLSIVITSLG